MKGRSERGSDQGQVRGELSDRQIRPEKCRVSVGHLSVSRSDPDGQSDQERQGDQGGLSDQEG